jgi:hypothetical protein
MLDKRYLGASAIVFFVWVICSLIDTIHQSHDIALSFARSTAPDEASSLAPATRVRHGE